MTYGQDANGTTVTYRPLPPSSFSLTGRSDIEAGSILYLMATGEYNYPIQFEGGGSSTGDSMLGVFVNSSGGYLSPGTESDPDIGIVTIPTHRRGLTTNISEDFGIPSNSEHCVKVQVPQNADRILFSTHDSFFSDNGDRDSNFQSHIHVIKAPEVEIGYSNPMQVIEAPQIEGDQQSGDFDYYEEPYDLVANKPFVVQAGFHKLPETLSQNTTLRPTLRIKQYNTDTETFDIIKTSNRCSNKFGKDIDTPGNVSDCNFQDFDFLDTTEGEMYHGKFNEVFVVEDGIDKPGRYTVEVDLYPDNVPCIEQQNTISSFEVEVHEIQSPRIGLAVANCDHIAGCTTPTNVGEFLDSQEVQLFNTLFPVSEKEGDQKFFRINYNVSSDANRILADIISQMSQENQQKYEGIISLALNVIQVVAHKILFGYDYLVGVGSTDFFTNVGVGLGASFEEDEDGNKNLEEVDFAFSDFDPPINRVAFIHSDEINTGTLLHELGHLLGQSKDFYEEGDDVEEKSYCTAHKLKIKNESVERLCHEFNDYAQGRGYSGYDSRTNLYVSNPFSIMGGNDDNNDQIADSLSERWKDRDTYIRTLNELKNPSPDPELTLFSGIYMNGQFFNGRVSHHGSGLLHPLSTEGDLRIILKDSSGQILSESKSSSSVQIELLGQGGEYITTPIVPIVVAFPYSSQATQVVLMKVNEDSTETMVFSKDLLSDNNPGYLLSDHYTYSTAENFPVFRNAPGADLIKKNLTNTTSAVFSKFMYTPGVRVAFDYNACSDNPQSGDGIALLFGKNPADYSGSTLPNNNQRASFNQTGVSIHLDMSDEIQLKNSRGYVLARTNHQDEGSSKN